MSKNCFSQMTHDWKWINWSDCDDIEKVIRGEPLRNDPDEGTGERHRKSDKRRAKAIGQNIASILIYSLD